MKILMNFKDRTGKDVAKMEFEQDAAEKFVQLTDRTGSTISFVDPLTDTINVVLPTRTAVLFPGYVVPAEGFVFNGVAGSQVLSVPDSVPNSPTGDIDISVRVAMDNWVPPGPNNQSFLSKTSLVSATCFRFFSTVGNGFLNLATSLNGSTVSTATSTVAPDFTPGQMGWVRVTRTAADGVVKFFTAPDDDVPVWAQLGTDRATTPGVLFDNPAAIELGAYSGGNSSKLYGKINEAHYKTALGGADVESIKYPDLVSASGANWAWL